MVAAPVRRPLQIPLLVMRARYDRLRDRGLFAVAAVFLPFALGLLSGSWISGKPGRGHNAACGSAALKPIEGLSFDGCSQMSQLAGVSELQQSGELTCDAAADRRASTEDVQRGLSHRWSKAR